MSPILGIWASSRYTQADTGAMFPLQVITVGAAGASSVTFTNIPSTYTHLQIRAIQRLSIATTDDNSYIQFNSDTGSNYAYHFIYGNGSSVAAGNGTSTSNILAFRSSGASSTSGVFGVGVMDILDYANTNKFKTTKALTGSDQNGSGTLFYWSGLWRSTNAITSINIAPASGNFAQYSQFALYGIRSA